MKKLLSILLLLSNVLVHGQQTPSMVKAVEYPGDGFRFVNTLTHVPVNDLTWDEAEPFENGFARVLKANQFTFVNTNGSPICPLGFDAARNFSNKLAAVEKNGRWGFINESGRVVIPFQYEIAFDFSGNISAVFNDKRWKLINTSGTIIHNLDIDVCYGFSNGLARIEKAGRLGTLTPNGEIQFSGETVPAPVRRNPSSATATSNCPANIDFEYGNLTNWNCYIGSVDSVGNSNVITVTPSLPIANRHRIYPRTMPSALDPMGLFPINPPDGSNYAVKLGNTNIGAQAERIQYSIHVPLNDSNFSIKYDYAVVFQDPGHTAWTQPRFIARLFDSAANAYVDCASFEYISTSSLPGFAVSTVDTSVIYKPWASVFISLRGYAGKTMYLEFTTADCVRRGHWGYAYVDVESTCGQSVSVQYDCSSPNITTLDGPPGFQTYNWWNQNFSSTLGTGQHVVLNPGPPANSTLWLELIPYSDFGCRDTMPVRITGSFNPNFTASDTIVYCTPHRITFYNTSLPSRSAVWDFGDGTTGTGDTVTHTYNLPGTYVVTLTVTLPGGCVGTTQRTVRVIQPTGSFDYVAGNFCNSQQVSFNAVTTNANSMIWYFGDGDSLVTNQHTVTHTYSTPGVYVPSLTILASGGCELSVPGPDTIRIENLDPGFIVREERFCNNSRLTFLDDSHSYFGITNYQWDYGDGTTGSGSTSTHYYTSPGVYNVQLVITGTGGCRDTIIQPVTVTLLATPVAFISGPRQVCEMSQADFTVSIQSPDSIASIQWSSSNGSSGSGSAFSTTFNQAGTYDVQVIVTTINGCSDTALNQVTVNPLPVVNLPPNQVICTGTQTNPVVFSSSVPNSTINWTNDFPAIGLPASGTGDIPAITGNNPGQIPIIANFIVSATANGCPGSPVSFSITVDATPVITTPSNQQVCNGGTTAAVIFTSFARNQQMNASFSWINDQPSIGLPANGNGDIPPFTAVNNSSNPVTATITISATQNGCPANPVSFTITVNPAPEMLQPPGQELCNGAASAAIQFTGNSSAILYSWTNDHPSIGIAASGTGNIPSFNASNTGNTPDTAILSISPSVNGCNGVVKYVSIIVNPTPLVNQPADQTVCNGSSINPILFTGNVANTMYEWTNNLPSIGLPANGNGDILAFNPVNNDISSNTATITVTPTIHNCPGTPKDFTITILPWANVTQPLNQFLCNGLFSPVVVFSGPLNNTTYNWVNSDTAIGLAASGTGDIPSFAAINTGNTPVTAIISVTATANNCPGNTKTFTITVDPTPDMLQPANQEVCNGSQTNAVSFTGTVTGTSFGWINSNPSIGLPANGSGDIPAFTAINLTHYPVTAMITVVGTANNCNSVERIFNITVNPSPDIDDLNDQFVCNGIRTDTIAITGPVMGTSYSWTNSQPSIGLPASGTGDIPSFVAINNSTSAVIATINVIAHSTQNCPPAGKTFKIIVNPTPNVMGNNDAVICRGSDIGLSVSGASQYSWSPASTLSCPDCTNPVATPADTTTYIVEGTNFAGCKAFDTIKVSVIQPFDMLVAPGDTICAGRSVQLNAQQAPHYTWSPSAGLNSTSIPNPVATPAGNTTYQVVGYDDHHCFTDTGFVTITVGPNPALEIGPDVTASTGSTVTFNPTTQNGPIVQWSWSPATNLSCSNCPNPTVTVSGNATYVLSVQNSFGCIIQDTVQLFTFCKGSQVFVPNAFTPDGDGLNDVLMIRGTGVTIKSFRVFNRWGIVVFEKQNFSPNEPRYGWDGKIRGVPATPDVYVYTAEVVCDNGVLYTYKGNTSILK